MSEYVLLIFIVLGAVTAITFFVRRTVQGRVRDARWHLQRVVRNAYNGTLYAEYEPYYINRTATVDRRANTRTSLLPGGSSGIFRKNMDETTMIISNSTTLPPKEAKNAPF